MVLGRHSVASLLLLLAALAGVCLAQSTSQIAPPGAAKVVSMTGQVSVLQDNYPWALHPGDVVKLKQEITTGPDGFASLQVSDGSTFEVYPNSRVIFRNNPSDWTDLLDVFIGRIKVHIQKLGGQPNHNRVHSPTALISVRGTIFDVVVDNDESTLISVDEGLVSVRHLLQPGPEKLVSPGEYLRVYRNQPLAQKSVDKSFAVQSGLRAASEAMWRIILGGPSLGGGKVPTTGTGGGSPGDTGGKTPPPAPPPPPAK
jgi:hypothetical protein